MKNRPSVTDDLMKWIVLLLVFLRHKGLPGEHIAELNEDGRIPPQVVVARVIPGRNTGGSHNGERGHQAGTAVLAALGDEDPP